jgi:Na+/H+-translocating membrane pyrophosphatase
VAFRAGSCMGFCLCAIGLLVLWILLQVSKGTKTKSNKRANKRNN